MRQTDRTLVVGGRHKARVGTHLRRARTVARANQARIQGQYEGGEYVAGIHLCRHRVQRADRSAVRPTGRNWSVSYDASVDDLVTQLKDLKPAGVITESTGGLELPLVAALAAASLPVAQSPPGARLRQVHRAVGRRLTGWMHMCWRTSVKQYDRRSVH